MAALLVAIAILSVVMLVALPTWSHLAQREKEAELIFRGEQYARAIGLYQRKLAGTFPPSLDVLVEQKFLRKKYKDPITGDDFAPVYAGTAGAALGGGAPAPGQTPGSDAGAPASQGAPSAPGGITSSRPGGRSSASPFGQLGAGGLTGSTTRLQGAAGGIVGVVSKSPAQSIKLYNGRNRYDQWIFVYSAASARPGDVGAPGQTTQPAGPGGVPARGPGRGGQ
ncbi:MAG: type II secretion system GspH family protein [Acidobacteriota bacterium]|nr:type II secretion system GspH family protein [Acidobacteriota bacterium]